MKNLRFALKAVSLAAVALLASCDLFGGETFTLSSGTYEVSSATLASANDQCGLLGAYTDPDKVIGITVNGTTATFNLSNDPTAAANTLPTATINGNAIETPVEANYTVAFGTTCVTRIHRDTRKILDEPEFRQKQLVDKGYEVVGSAPGEFVNYLKKDGESRARAVRISGAKAE